MNDSMVNVDQTHVVAYAKGDVTGGGWNDHVYLTGKQTPDSPYIQDITLVVQDGRSGSVTRVPLSDNTGYNPTLFLGDFTGNGVADILISINTGGSGAIMYHYIYSFLHNIPQLLFDFNVYNQHFQYEVTFQNYYNVEVISQINNTKYVIDISTRDRAYLNEIYHQNGALKSPIHGFVNPLSGLYPVDFDSNHVYELLAYQKIAGRYNADSLGYVLNTLGWQDQIFALQNQQVAIGGTQHT
ncbi:spore coat protein [Bacillus sp. FJAT-45037]|uniref:spore coat protein n=1 Tax=Bacillus sp. FJAT-45037 TaxID=2011007 RepID=UPI000C24D28D|nr:spore coat protein [Bacillus sp. FJAT-45037]